MGQETVRIGAFPTALGKRRSASQGSVEKTVVPRMEYDSRRLKAYLFSRHQGELSTVMGRAFWEPPKMNQSPSQTAWLKGTGLICSRKSGKESVF